jgi:leader peptidase (prepilin peptidase) / N-methyltransferase
MGIDAIFDAHNWSLVPFNFWSVCFFTLGCIVGSFLNVCIYRMPLELSVVHPPSHCPHCKYAIPFYLNIPLVTWLALRGRCKNCGAPISPRYFIVELLTGLLFLSSWLRFGHHSAWLAGVFSLCLAGLIVATFIDFEHFIIPDEITYGGIVVGLLISVLLPELHAAPTRGQGLVLSLVGVIVGAGVVYAILRLGKLLFGQHKIKLPAAAKIVFTETAVLLPDREIPYEEIFYRKTDTIVLQAQTVELIDRGYRAVAVRLSSAGLLIGDEKLDPDQVAYMEVECDEIILPREAMGLGDVKFMGAIGAFLGWQGALFSLMFSSLIGAVVGVVLIVLGRREWSSRMPYGPYIALAAAVWIFAGRRILAVFFPH